MTAMERKNSYNLQDLMDCAKEKLFGPGNARLPLPPMLMIDRITHISDTGGEYDWLPLPLQQIGSVKVRPAGHLELGVRRMTM